MESGEWGVESNRIIAYCKKSLIWDECTATRGGHSSCYHRQSSISRGYKASLPILRICRGAIYPLESDDCLDKARKVGVPRCTQYLVLISTNLDFSNIFQGVSHLYQFLELVEMTYTHTPLKGVCISLHREELLEVSIVW